MQGSHRYSLFLLLFITFFTYASELPSFPAPERTVNNGQAAVTSLASDAASRKAQNFLNNFGTSEIRIRTDQQLSFKESSGDFLFSLYSGDDDFFFTQLGISHDEDRLTTNVGLGHRHFYGDWLLGYNAFYDTTWNEQNTRWGAGIEAWRDYLKFSGNLYRRISGWHESHQHSDYLERPANGWDLRAEGWLPFLPQIGASLVYEHYYGDNVALGRFRDRHRNPVAMSAGLIYAPLPLINMGLDYKSGTQDLREARFNLGIIWRLGETLGKQLDPTNVGELRQIAGSKLDLVNRNNTIVLDYREQQNLTLQFPDEIRADEYTVQSITPVINSRHSIKSLELDDSNLIAAGGKIISSSVQRITFQMPSWERGQGIVLAAVAVDSKGNRSASAETRLWPASNVHILSFSSDKTTAINDGKDAATLILHVNDKNGVPLVNEEISLTTDGGTLNPPGGKTDEKGDIRTQITSTDPGIFHVTAIDGEYRITHQGITFTDTLTGVISASKTTALSNDNDSIQIAVTLTDARNQPVVGKTIHWTTTHGTLNHTDGMTGADGTVTVNLTSKESGKAIVTASNGDSSWVSSLLSFREPEWSLSLKPDKTHALASGYEYITYTLTARREESPIPAGEKVIWHSDFGKLDEESAVLDSRGQARVRLNSTTVGTARIAADVGGAHVKADGVSFTEVINYFMVIPSTARVGETIHAVAHGVVDGTGKILEGEPLYWTSNGGTLSSSNVPVNALGESHVDFTADKPGTYYVYSTVLHNTYRATVTITP